MANDGPKTQRSTPALTPEVRIAHPYVHERQTKRANNTPLEKPRYSAVLMLPKTHADPSQCANYRLLWQHAVEAARKMWPQSIDAAGAWVWPQGLNLPVLDGDVPYKPKNVLPGQQQAAAPADPNKYNWRKGGWQIEVGHTLEPGPRVCVMQAGQAVEIPAKVMLGKQQYKSGDYGYVSLYAYAWQHESGKFGVSFGFEGVLFTREGEAIGSSGPKSASAMFGGIAPVGVSPMPPGMASAAPAMPQPMAPAMPTAPAHPGFAVPSGAPAAPVAQAYAPPAAAAPLPPGGAAPAPSYAPPAPPAAPSMAPPPGGGLPPFPAPR